MRQLLAQIKYQGDCKDHLGSETRRILAQRTPVEADKNAQEPVVNREVKGKPKLKRK